MGSINRSHNEADGGILLFNGELILLYCDSVQCEVGGKESFKGRVYLTTHRLVIIISPYRQNAPVKSFCAPFCAITRCSVEQPIFGANYIEATVRDEADPSKSFSFKLKFSKGGAIELAMAMNRAVQAVGSSYNPSAQPPPAYTPSPSAQYYQAPPNAYAPGYNTGVQMPLQQFPDRPPIGFIYASEAPPPYPGLTGNNQGPGAAQAGGQYPQQTPSSGAGGYPGAAGGYPGQQQPAAHQQPGAGYPGHQQPPTSGGYPGQQQAPAAGYPGYPGQQSQWNPPGYPGQQQPSSGYPQQPPSAYPSAGQPAAPGYPGQQPAQTTPGPTGQPPSSSSGYPDLSQAPGVGGQGPPAASSQNWPTAPSFNPNWQEDKKNV